MKLDFKKDLLAELEKHAGGKWFVFYIDKYSKGILTLEDTIRALTCYTDQLSIYIRNGINVIDVNPRLKMIVVDKNDLTKASDLNRYFELIILSRA